MDIYIIIYHMLCIVLVVYIHYLFTLYRLFHLRKFSHYWKTNSYTHNPLINQMYSHWIIICTYSYTLKTWCTLYSHAPTRTHTYAQNANKWHGSSVCWGFKFMSVSFSCSISLSLWSWSICQNFLYQNNIYVCDLYWHTEHHSYT